MNEKERLLRIPEVVRKTGLAKSTIWAFIKTDRFPKPKKLSERVTVWQESIINQYIESIILKK